MNMIAHKVQETQGIIEQRFDALEDSVMHLQLQLSSRGFSHQVPVVELLPGIHADQAEGIDVGPVVELPPGIHANQAEDIDVDPVVELPPGIHADQAEGIDVGPVVEAPVGIHAEPEEGIGIDFDQIESRQGPILSNEASSTTTLKTINLSGKSFGFLLEIAKECGISVRSNITVANTLRNNILKSPLFAKFYKIQQ
eukprot:TRINITY_DN779_c0_g1_i1.p2 TRINITY_DN779_c0_g1~~TRINITY_DN779_c0_g1_i1.p2  ORF type:complete len:197 (+),score=30.94 TRINITY_DN779_c0_g1_i1:836-1426(+)